MLNFKQYLLNEEVSEAEFEADKEWLYQKSGGTIQKNIHGNLCARGHVLLNQKPILKEKLLVPTENGFEFKYQLEVVDGDFYVLDCNLTSFKNFPNTILGSLRADNNKFFSVEGMPAKIENSFDISNNPKLKSLSGIHKYLRSCDTISISPCVESNVLGLLKVKDLKRIDLDWAERVHSNWETILKVVTILSKHLKTKNVLNCQEELIDNNLEAYAQL